MLFLSFVIPCYRSEDIVSDVIDEIVMVVDKLGEYEYEIITVNDNSPDNLITILKNKSENNRRIKVIDLAKNVGKHAAIMAAYRFVEGDIIINLDDDGQCPMDRLEDLIEPLKNGYDMVFAKYPVKNHSKFKNIGSKVNEIMANILIDKPSELQISNFSAIKKYICKEIIRYDKPFPYIDGLFLRASDKIKNVPMEVRRRIDGTSGYTFKKSIKLWINGFTAFSVKPLRIAGAVGLVCSISGFLYGMHIVINKLINSNIQMGYSSIMSALLFIGGMIMLMLGLLGEYIGRIYICINNSPQYVIRETVNIDE